MSPKEQIKDVSWLAANANLADFRLVKVSSELAPVMPESNLETVEVRLGHELNVSQDDTNLGFQITFDVTVDPDNTSYFKLLAQFHVRFEKPVSEVDESLVKQFGETTVLFAAYPYLRELVQSLSVRAGIPPLSLNLFRAPGLADRMPRAEEPKEIIEP